MHRRFAIILGGGRSARMGRDKRALTLDGRSLLALAVAACGDREVVVVVTPDLPGDVPPDRVTRTLENPPFGGPVAGIAAGMAALPSAESGDEVLLLACDLPHVADIVAVLDAAPLGEAAAAPVEHSHTPPEEALGTPGWTATAAADGICLLDAERYPQYLAARYRRAALQARLAALGDHHAQSVRRLMAGLTMGGVAAPAIAADVDTPDEAAAAGLR